MKHRSLRMLCAPPPVGVPARGWVGGRTLLVAVRRDAAGRELLAWALAKAAAAGDRVVAVHVTTADGPGTDEMRSSAAADSLASVLAAYDGFCNLNKVDFPLGHCRALSSSSPLLVWSEQCLLTVLLAFVRSTWSSGSAMDHPSRRLW
jgi:hypothetical protein